MAVTYCITCERDTATFTEDDEPYCERCGCRKA